ncbi:GNAT family N-acetyltransferase [Magnetospirillum fulvum]|uniref:Acetyltransferase (GNAT) family protein n=1 Tax=Magnetospirillum fulvum TaxID=1082 RepID=A0A1H6HW05_MAGFU|nr:GNAT family N-acetyltransferase [Magnetospirillum fulvum]SEH38313.1 Acetyltransferase (GNAT) family protein [Magnetospirillum fulvum]
MLIRRLPPHERSSYADHLKRLSPEDRHLRFARAGVSDEWIDAHVAAISEDGLILVGVLRERVIAAAHLALDDDNAVAEVGLSVDIEHRSGGLGRELLNQAVVFARNRRAGKLYTLCLSDNRGMVALARRAGMAVEFSQGEAEAHLPLPPPDPLTVSQEMSTGLFAVFHDWAELFDRYGALVNAAVPGMRAKE